MKTRLRRLGIAIFVAMSLITWTGNAYQFSESELTQGAHFNALLLGSSLACLVVLIISEITDWGRRRLNVSRQEILLAELPLADPGYVQNTRGERRLDGQIAWRTAMLEGETDRPDREWIDVRQAVEADGLG